MKRHTSHRIAIDSYNNLYLCNYDSLYKITCDDGTYIKSTRLHRCHNRTIDNERLDGMSYSHLISNILYTVAVDQYDRVYLTDHDECRVIKFMDDEIVYEAPTSRLGPCGIAVNSEGDAYITYDD